MSIGTGAALAIGLGATAAGGIGSALIGSHAASQASKAQQTGAAQGIDQANKTYGDIQANLAPYTAAGTGALSQLVSGTAPGGSLTTPYGETYTQPAPYQAPAPFSYAAFNAPAPFQAPTLDSTNDPGYAFRLQQGNQAIQRAAAAGGGAFSGGTLKALTQYGQDYASNEYQNVYNRALQGYQTNFNNALQGYQTNFNTAFQPYQANVANALNAYNTNVNTGLEGYLTRLNAYNTGQTNQFNRLAALTGMGQTATGQLNAADLGTSQQIIDLLTGRANAQAAGDLGTAQAWQGGLGSISGGVNNAMNYLQGSQLLKLLKGGTGAYDQSGIGGGVPLDVAAGAPFGGFDYTPSGGGQ